MKRFKIGFLAIVALAAMSFTISENSNFFKGKRTESTVCYTDVTVKADCEATTGTVRYQEDQISCPSETGGLLNKHIWALGSSTYSLVDNGKPSECGNFTTDFCCVTIDTESGCNDQPNVNGHAGSNKYKVVRTFCRL